MSTVHHLGSKRWMRTIMASAAFLSLLSYMVPAPLWTHIAFSATTVVSGTVLLPDATPVASHSVQLHTPDGTKTSTKTTDVTGAFTFTTDDFTGASALSNGDSLVLEVTSLTGYTKPTNSPTNFTYSGSTYSGSPITFTFVSAAKTITGTTTLEDGTPKQGVDVRACPADSNVSCSSDTTDSNGDYSIDVSAPGESFNGDEFTMVVTFDVNLSDHNTDWLPRRKTNLVTFTNDSSAESEVVDATVLSGDDFGFVTATILNSDSSTLTTSQFRADCSITSSSGEGTIRKVDSSSALTRIGLPAGIYTIWCFHPDLNGKSFDPDEVTFVLTAAEEKDLGTITAVENQSTISGTVTDSDGNAVSNKQVTLRRDGAKDFIGVNTDSSGDYTATVGPGKWTIGITQGSGDVYRLLQPVTVTIAENGDTSADNDMTLELMNKESTLTIKDEDGNTLTGFKGSVVAETAGGEFFSAPVVDGIANMVFPEDLNGEEVSLKVSGDQSNYALTDAVTMTVGDNLADTIDLTTGTATLDGTLKDEDGNVITPEANQVKAFAVDSFGNSRSAEVGTDGTFSMENMAPGEWNVTFIVEDDASDVVTPPVQNTQVTLTDGDATDLDLTAKLETATISGTVLDPDGEPVAQAPVRVSNLAVLQAFAAAGVSFEPSDIIEVTGSTDADGNFSLAVPGGEDLGVFVGSTPDVDSFVQPDDVFADPVDGETQDFDFTFKEADTVISGTVLDTHGDAVSSGTVSAVNNTGAFVEADIAADGTYSLPVDSDGEWRVVATALSDQNVLKVESTVDASVGGTIDADLNLEDTEQDAFGTVTKTFAADGPANITLPNGQSVEIPAFAADDSGTITVIAAPKPVFRPGVSGDTVSVGLDLTVLNDDDVEVSGLQGQAKITMPLDPEILADNNIDATNLLPQFFAPAEGQTSSEGMTTIVNPDENEVVMWTNHFTEFMVNGVQSLASEAEEVGTAEHVILTPNAGGGPNVQVYEGDGTRVSGWMAFGDALRGHFDAVSADIDGDDTKEVVTVAGPGFGAQVRVFEEDGTFIDDFFAYDSTYRGGLKLAVGDVNGDGKDDIIVGPAREASMNVRAYTWDGTGFDLLDWVWLGGEGNTGVAYLATGDFDGDGDAEIVGTGGDASVAVYDFTSGALETMGADESLMPYGDGFAVQVATGDVDGDGDDEFVTSVLENGGPHIRAYMWNGTEFVLRQGFFAYQEGFRGGVNLAVGDVNGDGKAEIVTAPRTNGGPNVRAYTWDATGKEFDLLDWVLAYNEGFRGGVNIVVADTDGDGDGEIVTAPRTNGGPNVRVYDVQNGSIELADWFWGYAESFHGGVGLNK